MSINLNPAEAKFMWSDIIRFITVATIIHLLFYVVDDYGNFMNESILKILLYTTLGFLVYHLIINKLINRYLFPEVQVNTNKKTTETMNNITNSSKKVIKPILKKNKNSKDSQNKKQKKVKFKN